MMKKIVRVAKKLDKTLLLLIGLLVLALVAAFLTGGGEMAFAGLKQAGRLFGSVWIRLLMGFALGGLIRLLIPSALIAKWLGHSSGWKGLLIGSYLAVLMPGGPYITLPIIAAIYSAGAGVGPVIALLTGRGLLGIQMLVVWHIPFLGVEVPLARYIACLFIPPIVGFTGGMVFRMMTRWWGDAGGAALSTGDMRQRDKMTGTSAAPEKEGEGVE
jgi:uncharacterized membrane protein YraQ (UPF0718 family)